MFSGQFPRILGRLRSMSHDSQPISPINRAHNWVNEAQRQPHHAAYAALVVALAQAEALTRLADAAERYATAVEREAGLTERLADCVDNPPADLLHGLPFTGPNDREPGWPQPNPQPDYTPPLWQPHGRPGDPMGGEPE